MTRSELSTMSPLLIIISQDFRRIMSHPIPTAKACVRAPLFPRRTASCRQVNERIFTKESPRNAQLHMPSRVGERLRISMRPPNARTQHASTSLPIDSSNTQAAKSMAVRNSVESLILRRFPGNFKPPGRCLEQPQPRPPLLGGLAPTKRGKWEVRGGGRGHSHSCTLSYMHPVADRATHTQAHFCITAEREREREDSLARGGLCHRGCSRSSSSWRCRAIDL